MVARNGLPRFAGMTSAQCVPYICPSPWHAPSLRTRRSPLDRRGLRQSETHDLSCLPQLQVPQAHRVVPRRLRIPLQSPPQPPRAGVRLERRCRAVQAAPHESARQAIRQAGENCKSGPHMLWNAAVASASTALCAKLLPSAVTFS